MAVYILTTQTGDGTIRSTDNTWAGARSGSNLVLVSNGPGEAAVGLDATVFSCRRFWAYFDASGVPALGPNESIDYIEIGMYFDAGANFDGLVFVDSDYTPPLSTSPDNDWGDVGTTEVSERFSVSGSGWGWVDFTEDGNDYCEARFGSVIKIACRHLDDVDDSEPGSGIIVRTVGLSGQSGEEAYLGIYIYEAGLTETAGMDSAIAGTLVITGGLDVGIAAGASPVTGSLDSAVAGTLSSWSGLDGAVMALASPKIAGMNSALAALAAVKTSGMDGALAAGAVGGSLGLDAFLIENKGSGFRVYSPERTRTAVATNESTRLYSEDTADVEAGA